MGRRDKKVRIELAVTLYYQGIKVAPVARSGASAPYRQTVDKGTSPVNAFVIALGDAAVAEDYTR